jgi:hypothetical protein
VELIADGAGELDAVSSMSSGDGKGDGTRDSVPKIGAGDRDGSGASEGDEFGVVLIDFTNTFRSSGSSECLSSMSKLVPSSARAS